MAKVETSLWDAAEFIETPEDVALYLEAAFDEAADANDPGLIAHALGVVARSKGMAKIAEATGRSREQLYRSLSAEGNPTLATIMEVLRSLGVRLKVAPLEPAK
ncbi:MAG: addiction module antidote protein [Alphaproteobacteria bacterium]